MRQQLAQEAARIIAEEGIKDFHQAKQKAAQRLHAPDTRNLPRNDEIQEALRQYQRLFQADSQPHHLRHLREISVKAMRFFSRFEPRLVGAVLDGSAGAHSEIELHLFADPPDSVGIFLLEERIPFEPGSLRIALVSGQITEAATYRVSLDDAPIRLIVFGLNGQRQTPRDPVSGRGMSRANLKNIEELLRLMED